jgi:spermidine synthase
MKTGLSYLFPIRLKEFRTKLNGLLEINLVNGKAQLDSADSNYSFGSLQKILLRGLEEIKFSNEKNILLLGLGAGSVIHTIRKDYGSSASITAIEIDADMIQIANDYFKLNEFANLSIIEDDAFWFVRNAKTTYDLIIVDIFIGDKIPEVFTQETFLSNLADLLNPNAHLIYNTIHQSMPRDLFQNMLVNLNKNQVQTHVLKNLQQSNDLIIGRKN